MKDRGVEAVVATSVRGQPQVTLGRFFAELSFPTRGEEITRVALDKG